MSGEARHHGPRVALVIGVQKYDDHEILQNPKADVVRVADLLRDKGGFRTVKECFDPTIAELKFSLRGFEKVVKETKDCVAVLYFSGHGAVDTTGRHYMLGKDWSTTYDVGIALDRFGCKLEDGDGALSTMQDAYAGIVLFDACRNVLPDAPLPPTGGSGDTGESGGWNSEATKIEVDPSSKLLVCYACAPRSFADDGRTDVGASPFAEALGEHLCKPLYKDVLDALAAVSDAVKTKTTKRRPQLPVMTVSDPSLFKTVSLTNPKEADQQKVEAAKPGEVRQHTHIHNNEKCLMATVAQGNVSQTGSIS